MLLPREIVKARASAKTMKRVLKGDPINKIGIELEGGWEHRRIRPFVEWDWSRMCYEIPLHEDASLQREEGLELMDHMGEMVSEPMEVETAIKWMHPRWPQATSSRCGFHVHTSFLYTEDYVALMEEEFWEYWLSEWEKWSAQHPEAGEEFRSRLRGDNRYCKRIFKPEEQLLLKNKAMQNAEHIRRIREALYEPVAGGVRVEIHHRGVIEDPEPGHFRRCQLNFCWKMHGTLECRLFPMWKDATIAEKAIRKMLDIYRTFLRDEKRKSNAVSAVLMRRGVSVAGEPLVPRARAVSAREERTWVEVPREAPVPAPRAPRNNRDIGAILRAADEIWGAPQRG